jgi:hypothetical protein
LIALLVPSRLLVKFSTSSQGVCSFGDIISGRLEAASARHMSLPTKSRRRDASKLKAR